MENFEIIEDKTLELTFVVKDESHGVCNALRHILMQNPDVEYAVYNIDHPLIIKAVFNGTARSLLSSALA